MQQSSFWDLNPSSTGCKLWLPRYLDLSMFTVPALTVESRIATVARVQLDGEFMTAM